MKVFFCIDMPKKSAESTGCASEKEKAFFHALLDEFLEAISNGDEKATLNFEKCASHICAAENE